MSISNSVTFIIKRIGIYEYGVKKYLYKGAFRYRAYITDHGLQFTQKSPEWFDNYEQAAELARAYAQAHEDACARTAARNAACAHK